MSLKLDPTREQSNGMNLSTSGASMNAPSALFRQQQNIVAPTNLEQQGVLRQQEIVNQQNELAEKTNSLLKQQNELMQNMPLTSSTESLQSQPYNGIVGNNKYRLTTRYGGKSALSGRPHYAIDIGIGKNNPIYNPARGVVERVKDSNGEILIRYDNGYKLFLAHLEKRNFNPGDVVNPGDVIGLTGSRGYSTGPHLHLQILDPNGKPYDPTNFYYGKDNPFTAGKGETMDELNMTIPEFGLEDLIGQNQTFKSQFINQPSITNNKTLGAYPGSTGLTYNPYTKAFTDVDKNIVYDFDPTSTMYFDPNKKILISRDELFNRYRPAIKPTSSQPSIQSSYEDPARRMVEGQINAIPINNESIFNNIYGNIGVPRQGNFGSDPIDQTILDLKLVDPETAKTMDSDTLNAVRAMVGQRTRAFDVLGREAAQTAASQINTAQQAKRAFIGRNPGDVSQSFAGRNAIASFDQNAVNEIAKSNLAFDKMRNDIDAGIIGKSLTAMDTAKQRQLAIDLQKAGMRMQAAMADNSARAERERLEAAKDINIKITENELRNADMSQQGSIYEFLNQVNQSLLMTLTTSVDENQKAEALNQIRGIQDKMNIISGNLMKFIK